MMYDPFVKQDEPSHWVALVLFMLQIFLVVVSVCAPVFIAVMVYQEIKAEGGVGRMLGGFVRDFEEARESTSSSKEATK